MKNSQIVRYFRRKDGTDFKIDTFNIGTTLHLMQVPKNNNDTDIIKIRFDDNQDWHKVTKQSEFKKLIQVLIDSVEITKAVAEGIYDEDEVA